MWKKRLITACWILIGASLIVLLVAAMQVKEQKRCAAVDVTIHGVEDHLFVDEKKIMGLLNATGELKGKAISAINLRVLESRLEKDPWIRNAELFFDNTLVLNVRVQETEPVARIFTLSGNSFYIDTAMRRLSLSESVSARVPMFTSFPSDNLKLSSPDSAVMADVKKIALHIKQDSFWMAQVAQVDITPKRTYQVVPVLGNQIIELGDANNIEKKFRRLFAFYKNVWSKTGFEKYATIDVQYEGQVVATRRGAISPKEDSLRAMQLLTHTIEKVNEMVRDSLMQIQERKEPVFEISAKVDAIPAENKKPEMKPENITKTNADKVVNKLEQDLKKKAEEKKKNAPKAVMRKQ